MPTSPSPVIPDPADAPPRRGILASASILFGSAVVADGGEVEL